jgi:hypothetical protein
LSGSLCVENSALQTSSDKFLYTCFTTVSKEMTQEGCSTPPAGQIAPPNTPDQPSLHVPTLIRSDDKPGLGVMSGGEKQDSGTWQEKLQGKAPGFHTARSLTSMLTSAEKCREVHINPPIYEIFSDKRGKQVVARVLASQLNERFQVAARLGLVKSLSPANV